MKFTYKSPLLLATCALLLIGGVAHADDHMTMDHSKMDHSMMQKESNKMPASDTGMKSMYDDAMMKMHEDMAKATPTGDADTDFVTGMIPHHQGAIDMAKIEVEKGKDPEIKKLAQDIIKAQEKEIEFMNKWLEKNHPTKN